MVIVLLTSCTREREMPSESALNIFLDGYDQLQAKDMLMVISISKNEDPTPWGN